MNNSAVAGREQVQTNGTVGADSASTPFFNGPFARSEFLWGDKIYKLNAPTECVVTLDEGHWLCECAEFGMMSAAAVQSEALSELDHEFAFLCDGLLGQPDGALTVDARDLRDKLFGRVQEIVVRPQKRCDSE